MPTIPTQIIGTLFPGVQRRACDMSAVSGFHLPDIRIVSDRKKDKRGFDVLDFALEKFHRFVSLQ